jgi:hypothetical protein
MRPNELLADGLACTASNISSSFCTFRLPRPTCVGDMNAPVFFILFCIIINTCLLCCLRSGYRAIYSSDAVRAFPLQTQYIKCILECSEWVNRAFSFRRYQYFSVGTNVNLKSMKCEFLLVSLYRPGHTNKRNKIKSETVANRITVCLRILF